MTLPVSIPVNPALERSTLADGRARFREIVDTIIAERGKNLPDARSTDDFFYALPDEDLGTNRPVNLQQDLNGVRIVVVPGYLTECVAPLVDCLTDGLAHLNGLGARTSIAQVAGRGSCAHNANLLRNHILDTAQTDDKATILIPMSKGAPDTLEMLQMFPDMADHIDAIVSLVGCVGGSPLKYMAPGWLKWVERNLPMPNCARHNGDAVVSLSPDTRTAFLKQFNMPASIKTYSIGAIAREDMVSKGLITSYRALCKYDNQTGHLNDAQMMFADQFLPNATFLGALNCDHIATAMPVNRSQHWFVKLVARLAIDKAAFPREVLVEAIIRQVLEDLD
ncbi:MAG: hypothetical protein OQK24_06710 [Magnetovibrio sp.]|nr:hypothetical protein [Magnetovibrio sp.]